jgi:prepilin-type N-terminal cleavage/methylation domain-containing protein
MIKNRLSQKHKYHAFTLIEMVIVLVIVGIMLSITMYLSAEQIQKVKDKTVKESIIAEMQSRYSRNL